MSDTIDPTKSFPQDYGKSVAPGYDPPAFFFRQFDEERGTRIVAWTGELGQMKRMIYAILSQFPEEVEILLKVELPESKPDDDPWSRYHGEVSKEVLAGTLRHYERFFFHDGHHQLCVKHADAHEYFAYDEHGILWLYPYVADELAAKLKAQGFAETKPQQLLTSFDNWRCTPPESESLRDSVILGLGLSLVEREL